MNKLLKQAFTLIELLVVIAIIGILSGLIVVSMGGMANKATIAKAQVFSNSLRNSLMMNIVGEWKFDEGSGTVANDSWKKINNGVLIGFTDTTAGYGDSHASGWMSNSSCVSGTCLKFDGTDDYVDCGNDSTLRYMSNISISAWITFSNFGGTYDAKTIYNKGGNNAAGTLWFYQNTSSNRLYFEIDQTTHYYSWVPTLNQWYNLVVTYDGSNVKWYIDGSNVNTLSYGTKTINSASNAIIGSYAGISGRSHIGLIDDVRIYNAAVPTSQIKEQYYFGLNSLFLNGGLTKKEYLSRINEMALGN